MHDSAHPSDDHGSSLHGLLGTGRSRVSAVGAMRARDVSRSRPSDIAAAEKRAAAMIAARVGGHRSR